MKKILFLVHRIPYPPNKGDKIRSFNELKLLSRFFSVDLLCFADEPSDLKHEADLRRYCDQLKVFPLDKNTAIIRGIFALLAGRALSSRYFYLKAAQRTFDEWLRSRQYTAILCFSSSTAEYIFQSHVLRSPAAARSPRLVMDFCDVDSDKWRQYAEDARFPLSYLYRLESKRLRAYEHKIQRSFRHTILISDEEAELFRRTCPEGTSLSVISHGIDLSYFSPAFQRTSVTDSPPDIQGGVIVFTGAMNYPVNVAGVSWFVSEAWPLLRQRYPALQFYIVGSNPVSRVRELNRHPGVVVTGFVADIRDYYAIADVCVAPLHQGRGVQNKVLEAMAMGRPVVATSRANAGVRGESQQHLIIADSAGDFVHAVSSLLDNPAMARALGARGREFVVSRFDWEANMARLKELLTETPRSEMKGEGA